MFSSLGFGNREVENRLDFSISKSRSIPHFTIFGRFFVTTRRWAGNTLSTKTYNSVLSNLCATFTSLILTKPQPVLGSDAGNQPPAPDPSRRGGVMSAARLVVCPGPKPFVMGLPCVFVIGLLASTISATVALC